MVAAVFISPPGKIWPTLLVTLAGGMLVILFVSRLPVYSVTMPDGVIPAGLLAEGEHYTSISFPGIEYVFEYPAGWRVEKPPAQEKSGLNLVEPSTGNPGFSAVLLVRRYEKTAPTGSLDATMKELEKLVGSGTVRLLETRTLEIDGNPSKIVALARIWRLPISLGEVLELAVVERYLLIEHGVRLYTVTYVAAEDHDRRFARVFDHVVQTFHFLPARKEDHR